MTIRIPKRLLLTLLAVIVLGGVGVGGYALGRHSRASFRAGLAKQLSRLERHDASIAVDEAVHQSDTAQLLMNLCNEVVRLPPSFGYFDPASCNPGALVYAPSAEAHFPLVSHHDSMMQGISEICGKVLQVESAHAFFDQRAQRCLAHVQQLPSRRFPTR